MCISNRRGKGSDYFPVLRTFLGKVLWASAYISVPTSAHKAMVATACGGTEACPANTALESSYQVTRGCTRSLTGQAEDRSAVGSSVLHHCSGWAETLLLPSTASLYNHFACSGAKEWGRIFGKEG